MAAAYQCSQPKPAGTAVADTVPSAATHMKTTTMWSLLLLVYWQLQGRDLKSVSPMAAFFGLRVGWSGGWLGGSPPNTMA